MPGMQHLMLNEMRRASGDKDGPRRATEIASAFDGAPRDEAVHRVRASIRRGC